MNYYVVDNILGAIGIGGFVLFLASVFAMITSFLEGGIFTTLQAGGLLLIANGSVLVMHVAGRMRVKLWVERIKQS